MGRLSSEDFAQQAHEADPAIEGFRGGVFGFEAYSVQFGRTTQAVRQLRWSKLA
jgi:hypothetical protein